MGSQEPTSAWKTSRMNAQPFDAILLVSFGGPEKPEDVVPFLENVTGGRGIPRERLEEVGEHYFGFGGKSPINDLNRQIIANLEAALVAVDLDVPVYWGNRNWDPYLIDAGRQMEADGIKHAACFATSAYSSYSSCRQYREDLFEVDAQVSVTLTKLRPFFNHPGFIGPFVEALRGQLADAPQDTHVVFVTHSIPESMNVASGGADGQTYLQQHEAVAAEIIRELGIERNSLAFCSRSGPPHMPWLEPDINDHLRELAGQGVTSVAVVPIGFVSDHMEVVYDLDTEAADTARELDMRFVRTPTPGQGEGFAQLIIDLVQERAAVLRGETPKRACVGALGPRPDQCPSDCCVNPRSTREALS
jgi:protoporphyrin/coproporphyrin ferrochelatase